MGGGICNRKIGNLWFVFEGDFRGPRGIIHVIIVL